MLLVLPLLLLVLLLLLPLLLLLRLSFAAIAVVVAVVVVVVVAAVVGVLVAAAAAACKTVVVLLPVLSARVSKWLGSLSAHPPCNPEQLSWLLGPQTPQCTTLRWTSCMSINVNIRVCTDISVDVFGKHAQVLHTCVYVRVCVCVCKCLCASIPQQSIAWHTIVYHRNPQYIT